jgi:hypothetical protein
MHEERGVSLSDEVRWKRGERGSGGRTRTMKFVPDEAPLAGRSSSISLEVEERGNDMSSSECALGVQVCSCTAINKQGRDFHNDKTNMV